MGYIFLFIVLIIAISFGVAKLISIQEKEEENIKIKEHKQKLHDLRDEEIKALIIPNYNKARAELIGKYGYPSKEYKFEQHNLEREIIVFEDSRRVWICGRDLSMENILTCNFIDVELVIKQLNTIAKPNREDLINSVSVGDVFIGREGEEIVPNAAASSNNGSQQNDETYHDYTIIVNVDSFSEPIIKIKLASDAKKVNEIINLINAIIESNKNVSVDCC